MCIIFIYKFICVQGLDNQIAVQMNQIAAQLSVQTNQIVAQNALIAQIAAAQIAQNALIAQIAAAQNVQIVQIAAAQNNQYAQIVNLILRSTNSSAIAGLHTIEPLRNGAGQLPAWFPQTKDELCESTAAQILALINHYNIVIPAGAGSVHSRRLRSLKNYLGVRQ